MIGLVLVTIHFLCDVAIIVGLVMAGIYGSRLFRRVEAIERRLNGEK